MDTPDAYPDLLGDALSYSSQRLAQLGWSPWSPAAAVVEAQRRAEANAARAAGDEQALASILRETAVGS
jgi:hypothetical protein